MSHWSRQLIGHSPVSCQSHLLLPLSQYLPHQPLPLWELQSHRGIGLPPGICSLLTALSPICSPVPEALPLLPRGRQKTATQRERVKKGNGCEIVSAAVLLPRGLFYFDNV